MLPTLKKLGLAVGEMAVVESPHLDGNGHAVVVGRHTLVVTPDQMRRLKEDTEKAVFYDLLDCPSPPPAVSPANQHAAEFLLQPLRQKS